MNKKTFGILLISIGVLLLAYKGITYKTEEKVVDLGPLQVTQEKTKTFPFSPVFGGAALMGGLVLILLSEKRTNNPSS